MRNIANRNDVAKRVKVSGATVSRVFNKPDVVSPEVRQRVLEAARELNYHPNKIASNFVKGISGNIGVIVPLFVDADRILSSYYISHLLGTIGKNLNEKGYDLVLFFHEKDPNGENDYTKYFRNGKVDGCIFLSTRSNDKGLQRLKETDYKFCVIEDCYDDPHINSIALDDFTGAYKAVEHLIELGHRKIAFLAGPTDIRSANDRHRGYLKALTDYSLPVREDFIIQCYFAEKDGYDAAFTLLKNSVIPTAVFCANDDTAIGLMKGLMMQKVRIPDDIAVVGYDDAPVATMIEPNLTTVRNPLNSIGQRCVEEFIKVVSGESKEHFHILIEPELIIRESSVKKS